MSDFERIYKDGVPIERSFSIEKSYGIEKISLISKNADGVETVHDLLVPEKPIEKSKSESPKRKPKRVHSKPHKAAVARLQKKL